MKLSHARPGSPAPIYLVIQHVFLFVAVVSFAVGMHPIIRLGIAGAGQTNDATSAEGNPLNQVFFAAIYAILIALFIWRFRFTFRITLNDILIWSLSFLCFVSVLWSFNPALTFRRAIPLLGTALLATVLGTHVSLSRQVKLIAIALFVALALAIVYVVAFPAIGIDDRGAWRGYFPTKNELGRLAIYLSVATLYWQVSGPLLAIFRFGILFTSFLVVILSSSATALVVWLVVIGAYSTFRFRRDPKSIAAFGSVVGAIVFFGSVASIWLYFKFAEAMALLGKDPTLTGRTHLWTSSIDLGLERPILGYGFNGFWSGGPDSPARPIVEAAQFPGATHAHNGFIDVFTDTGFTGLGILLLIIAITVVSAWRSWLRTGELIDSWPLTFMAMIVVSNMAESIFIRHSAFPWLIFSTVAVSASRRYLEVSGKFR